VQDEELEDGDAGMLALWALLNMSTFPGAQRSIAHHCLLTLLKLTYVSPSQQKANVASHILSHIRKNKVCDECVPHFSVLFNVIYENLRSTLIWSVGTPLPTVWNFFHARLYNL
jgi:hypothetical protein